MVDNTKRKGQIIMKNIDVIKAFIYGEQAHTLNLMSSGDKLINYSTCIAQRKDGQIYVTDTKFSKTTSVIQNALRRELLGINYKLVPQQRGRLELV